MPNDPLFGPRLKVERAERHIKEIELGIEAFIDRNPYAVVPYDDPQSGDQVWRVHVREPVPACISAMLGDAVHNLRAAFDLIACQIVSIGSGTLAQVYFPINGNAEFV